jgi:hypothetical protein
MAEPERRVHAGSPPPGTAMDIAFDQSVPEFDRAVCAAGRPRLASWLSVECP